METIFVIAKYYSDYTQLITTIQNVKNTDNNLKRAFRIPLIISSANCNVKLIKSHINNQYSVEIDQLR